MPTTKTAEKEMRVANRRQKRNQSTRNSTKTLVTKAEGAIAGGNLEAAKAEVYALIREPEVGETYDGIIRRVVDFGLFVELFPGKEGLLHVSKVSDEFIKNLASVYSVGDRISVVLEKIDEKGRLNLKRS